ncbi:MAG: hypothetical protein WBB01_24275 [Phormidesmis sp.]
MTASEWTETAIRLEHKGYVGGAERDTTGYLQGAVEGLVDSVIVYDGKNVAELAADFVSSVEEYLADCEADGLPAETTKILSAT